MKNKHSEQWEKLGESDPYWAVLTDPNMKDGKWNAADFFATGELEVNNLLLQVGEFNSKINFSTALDFGCGVGRLSRALSKKFKKVMAVDVSKSMLIEAEKANKHITNIDFVHNSANDLKIFPNSSIDFLYSNIVLQHMPRERQTDYIKEFCRVLCPEGIMAFQTPAKCNLKSWKGWVFLLAGNRVLNVIRRIKYGPSGIMEVHTIPRQAVLNILEQQGMTIMGVQRYDSAGAAFESYMYFAIKN